ncbi:hypothetical protein FKM82_004341 [Ascaphus truei]
MLQAIMIIKLPKQNRCMDAYIQLLTDDKMTTSALPLHSTVGVNLNITKNDRCFSTKQQSLDLYWNLLMFSLLWESGFSKPYFK